MNKYISGVLSETHHGLNIELNAELVKTKSQALEASIEKWETVSRLIQSKVNLFLNEGGSDSCGLCTLYYHIPKGDCKRCPVYKQTGLTSCKGTPYREYISEKNGLRRPYFLLKAAKREAEFLRSLRTSKKVKKDE